MKPTKVKNCNGTLGGGPAKDFGTEDDVGDLAVCRTEKEIISEWRASWSERIRILCSGRVWLRVIATDTHSPVVLEGQDPFL